MWDQLLKAIEDKDQDKAIKIIHAMTSQDFDRDYSKLIIEQSPIHLAVDLELIEVTQALISVDPNLAVTAIKIEYGNTPLHTAAYHGREEAIKILIKAGSNLNAPNNYGRTPLYSAAMKGYKEAVKLLVEAGADINRHNNDNDTPLHAAAAFSHKEVVEVLIKAKASVNATNQLDETPLHAAVTTKIMDLVSKHEVIEVLINAGAKLEAIDKEGQTPLHWAVENGCRPVVKLLLAAGANPNIINKEEKTVLDIAANTIKDLETMELLKDASAIHKIIASPALDQQEIKIEDKVEIKNLDLLSSILNHNFQLHNKAYKSKAELKHIFDLIQPNSAQQQVEIDKIKAQFNKVIESGIDYADQSKIADLQYLAAVSPLVQILKIVSDKATSGDQKAQAFADVLNCQTLNIPEDYRTYITQVFKLNAKMIKKIAQTYPKVAKDLFNIITCTNEQRDQYKAKIEEVGYDIKEGISITTTEHLKSESDITSNDDIFSLFPQSTTIAELFPAKISPEEHLPASANGIQISIIGQPALSMTDYHMEIPD